MVYGLGFSKSKIKLSYIKNSNDTEKELYYLFRVLNADIHSYTPGDFNSYRKDSSYIEIDTVVGKKFNQLPPVKNIMYGGQQEHGIRPGTIPVALVAGCGRACEIAEQNYLDNETKLQTIKYDILDSIRQAEIKYKINGDQNYCVNSTLNICFPGVSSEALMLSTKQYCSISNGSACTSQNYSPSYVLTAMGIPEDEIESSVRISWGPDEKPEEIVKNMEMLLSFAKQMIS